MSDSSKTIKETTSHLHTTGEETEIIPDSVYRGYASVEKIFYNFVSKDLLCDKQNEEKRSALAADLTSSALRSMVQPHTFLHLRNEGKLLNTEFMQKKEGCFKDFVHADHFPFFVKLIENNLKGFGTPNAAIGKGEGALIVFSPSVKKPKKGDLDIQGCSFEVKGDGGKISAKTTGKELNKKMLSSFEELGLKAKKEKMGKRLCFWKSFSDNEWWQKNTPDQNKQILRAFWRNLGMGHHDYPEHVVRWDEMFVPLLRAVYHDFFFENPGQKLLFIDTKDKKTVKYWIFKDKDEVLSFYKERFDINDFKSWRNLIEHRSFQANPFSFYLRT